MWDAVLVGEVQMKCFRLCAIGLLSLLPLCAQVATGRITGRVSDSSGAVVPGGSVIRELLA